MAEVGIQIHSTRYHSNPGSSFGKFVVISNETFLDRSLGKRTGTEKDVERLKKTFSRVGFDFKGNIYKDQTCSQMLQIMTDIAKCGLENYNCLAIAILTHGADNGLIHGVGSTGDIIPLDILFQPLKYGKKLDGKPKLIFIQACRGEELDPGKIFLEDAPGKGDHHHQSNFIKIPVEADFLYHFSTSPGYYSFRSSSGSVFIQSLCSVAALYLENDKEIDLMKLLTQVNRVVAEEFSSYVPTDLAFHDMKQMPCILSMLRKDVYLPSRKPFFPQNYLCLG